VGLWLRGGNVRGLCSLWVYQLACCLVFLVCVFCINSCMLLEFGSLSTSDFVVVNLCKCLRQTLLLSSQGLVLWWEMFFYFLVCFVPFAVFS